MTLLRPTYRTSDGERIPGSVRNVFICNMGTYFLTDLVVYADGLVDCWGLMTLEEFAAKLESGWVATEFEEGAEGSLHGIVAWRFSEPDSYIDAESLLAEVRDTVEELNGRPDSSGRCLEALDAFLADPTEPNRAALRKAYLEIPPTQRRYVLGDMDLKDGPLRALVHGPGGTDPLWGRVITEEHYEGALEYFAERKRGAAEIRRRDGVDEPRERRAAAITLEQRFFPDVWPDDAGVLVLRNECPAPIEVDGAVHRTVWHAYWALATDDERRREQIRLAPNGYQAQRLGRESPRRGDWADVRLAVMTRLLRAKFDQHPELAEVLLATGNATLLYNEGDSPFWGGGGRNWLGRLLELVRAELRAARPDR